ncbi:MAG TPA: 50S ribosomal protein L11 methyltransferase [Polyangia bacterium]|nr:50S ribosomal protein L11 methyltransferase [Polyangia bacterium]
MSARPTGSESQTNWLEIAVDVPADLSEVMAALLGDVAAGVELRDAGTLLRAEAGRAVVVAHVAPDDRDAALQIIDETVSRARDDGAADPKVSVRERAAHEDEWRDVWKQFFRATRVGKTFIVRPSWDPGALVAGDRVIDLDPGRAFGTGGHATTRLVIELAEELADERARAGAPVRRFLDLGCGSGILSIAAARLWPDAAGFAADVDPEATACTVENLERNKVTTVEVATGTLELYGDAAPFDVVLANIQADVLTQLAPALYQRIGPGGTAILSGLLTDGAAAVSAAYVAAGFQLLHRRESDEWTGLTLSRS